MEKQVRWQYKFRLCNQNEIMRFLILLILPLFICPTGKGNPGISYEISGRDRSKSSPPLECRGSLAQTQWHDRCCQTQACRPPGGGGYRFGFRELPYPGGRLQLGEADLPAAPSGQRRGPIGQGLQGGQGRPREPAPQER